MIDDAPTIEGLSYPPSEGWELVLCQGGRHHGVRFWSYRPPRRWRVVADGDVYELAYPGVYVAEGHHYGAPPAPDTDQLSLG